MTKTRKTYKYDTVMYGTPDYYTGEVLTYRTTYATKQKAEKAARNIRGLGYDCYIERTPENAAK